MIINMSATEQNRTSDVSSEYTKTEETTQFTWPSVEIDKI